MRFCGNRCEHGEYGAAEKIRQPVIYFGNFESLGVMFASLCGWVGYLSPCAVIGLNKLGGNIYFPSRHSAE